MGFDYIVGEMACAFCRAVSGVDSGTNMQTKICVTARHAKHGVGARLDIYHPVPDSGYICLIEPAEPLSFSFIDFWGCPTCDRVNGACIALTQGTIVSIEAILPTQRRIEGINYISDDYDLYGWSVCGQVVIRGVVDI